MNKRGKKFTYKKYLVWAIIICIAFLIGICPILNWFNELGESGKFLRNIANGETINEGVTEWFGFWASFSGTLATVLVGAVTLRLTEKIQDQNDAEERLKKQLSIITEIPYMKCEKACIFSLRHNDFLYEHLTMEGEKNNYCLALELDTSFPPYFDIVLKGILIYLPIQEEEKPCPLSLKKEDYRFINHDGVKIVINLPSALDEIMYHAYVSDLEITNVTPYEKRNVCIDIEFSCKNVLFNDESTNNSRNKNTNDNNVDFTLKITAENVGKTEKLKGKRLRVNNLQFERVNYLEKNNE